MWGTYTTDDQGRLLTIFGTEQGLRYRIPWRPVDELIEYLRANATEDGERVGIMGDDGEKFGALAGHVRAVLVEREVGRQLLRGARGERLVAGYRDTVAMDGRAPIRSAGSTSPTSSYIEMTEWALPAAEQPIFHDVVETATDRDLPEARFLRGAHVAQLPGALPRDQRPAQADAARLGRGRGNAGRAARAIVRCDHLYRGQSNDCYWHGWFGGIYIVHMRMATLAELIAAEDLALGADDGAERSRRLRPRRH